MRSRSAYHSTRAPSWALRFPLAVRTFPKEALLMVMSGPAKECRFSRLKVSIRTCSFTASVIENDFDKVASSFQPQSPRTVEKRFGLLPSDCGAASENAVGSKKRLLGFAAFHGSNLLGSKTLLNPPAGVV